MDESLGKSCKLCGYVYCVDHLLPQRHQCLMLQNVEYVKADSSQDAESDLSGLPGSNLSVHSGAESVPIVTTPAGGVPYWLHDCLKDAKDVILEYHDEKPDDQNFADCAKFFGSKTFDIKIQNNGNASGDINVIKDLPSQPSYRVCIHDIFQEDTRSNRRMVTLVLIHQLLHAIHPSRMHDQLSGQKGINKMERELANKASYHDALINLEALCQSGKVLFCNI